MDDDRDILANGKVYFIVLFRRYPFEAHPHKTLGGDFWLSFTTRFEQKSHNLGIAWLNACNGWINQQ
eukprot:scaffold37.g4392.t1